MFFPKMHRPIQAYDENMQRLERANPETFRVERRSQFAMILDAYLSEGRVDQIFEPWPSGRELLMQSQGVLGTTYYAHGDPAKSGANFGFAIAHVEIDPATDLRHVVFDSIHAWLPSDYPENNYEIDYLDVEADLKIYLDAFTPEQLTFDSFNSIGIIQRLRKHAIQHGYPKRVMIYERTFTRAINWQISETFKTAIGLGLVHAPTYELAELELKYLQDVGGRVEPPTSGPIQTKDTADCLMVLTWALIGDQVADLAGELLGGVTMHTGLQGGMNPYSNAIDPIHQQLSQLGQGMDLRPPTSAARGGRFDPRVSNPPRGRELRDFQRRPRRRR